MGELEGKISTLVRDHYVSSLMIPSIQKGDADKPDSWDVVENRANLVANYGVFLWHNSIDVEKVRAIYREAAASYLARALWGIEPVERRLSIQEHEIKELEANPGGDFLRVERDQKGKPYGVFLWKHQPGPYHAEEALACALIAQDWELADSLAKAIPLPLSITVPETMAVSLLRYTVHDQQENVLERLKVYSAHPQGIDFAPRRSDFAVAIVQRDGKLLAKALKATIQSFRRKWELEKYVKPLSIIMYGSREESMRMAAQELVGMRWAYSSWGVAMMCLAGRFGVEIPNSSKSYSDFLPYELCMPAKG